MANETGTLRDTPQQPIPQELQYLSNQITDLDVALDRLLERIVPVMGPAYDGPSPENVDIKATEEKSVVARDVASFTARLSELTHTIQRTTERIEL